MSRETFHWAVAMYAAGLLTGSLFTLPARRRARRPIGPESPEESLARLQGRRRGGYPSQGPLRDPVPPPARRGTAVSPVDRAPRGFPPGMPLTGPPGGSGQARAR